MKHKWKQIKNKEYVIAWECEHCGISIGRHFSEWVEDNPPDEWLKIIKIVEECRFTDIVNEAYREANKYYHSDVDKTIHSFPYYYQMAYLKRYSEEDIINGVLDSYIEPSCKAKHSNSYIDYYSTDECRMFKHPGYMGRDHFNMRHFKEWCEANNPKILEKINKLKCFI